MDAKLRQILAGVQKPGRYTGGEPGSICKPDADFRFAFCFPDTYEVGMSFLGMKILYELLNGMDGIACERAFMPWVDMADALSAESYPLYALESKKPLTEFDAVGFTLQYELCYTNVLAMLDLAGIPLRAADRDESWPLVVAGGPCCCNPEPMAPFFDAIMLGEGERHLPQLCQVIRQAKKDGINKQKLLEKLAKIEGVYIPAFYSVHYNNDGKIEAITPENGAPARVKKAFLPDFESFPLPENFVVPMVGAVHDRAQIEVLRGCVRGCRFCQAGFIYRPMRQRDADMLNGAAKALCANTGYEEVSLTSLSTSDHSQLEPLMDKMLAWTTEGHINLALPSLRIDNFTESMVEKISKVRKSGLTFAPEAGTQRLRDIINKNITDEEIDNTCRLAFEAGYSAVKLYFMMGLPGETMEDIEGIADTAQRVVDLYYSMPGKKKGQGAKVTISVACFVPKPFTPFQYWPQDTEEMLRQKQKHLLASVKSKKISVKYHDSRISFIEAVFARGDRRLADVVEAAWRAGCRFDGWDDQFRYETWLETFDKLKIDPAFYANRAIGFDEVTAWSHLDYCVDEAFLQKEYKKAMECATTQPCNRACAGCGANALVPGGACFAYR